MHIRFLVDDLSTPSARARSACALARELATRGHRVDLVPGGPAPFWETGQEVVEDRGAVDVRVLWGPGAVGHAREDGTRTVHLHTGSPRDVELPVGVDLDRFRPGSPRHTPHRVRVGVAGTLRGKGTDVATALAACALAQQAGQDLHVVRLTDEPTVIERELPFPVEFVGALPDAERATLLKSLDALIIGSGALDDGDTLLPLEALACGIPCVIEDRPALRTLGGDPYALFVQPGVVGEWAEALVLCARHTEVSTALAAQARHTAERYPIEATATAFERLLEDSSQVPEDPVTDKAQEDLPAELATLSADISSALRSAAAGYTAMERFGAARRHLEAAVQIQPDDVELEHELARARYLDGDDTGALALYDDLLTQGVDEAEIDADRGIILFSLGREEEAERVLTRAAAALPEDAALLNDLGVVLFHRGKVDGARSCFEQVLARDPEHREAAANLARLDD